MSRKGRKRTKSTTKPASSAPVSDAQPPQTPGKSPGDQVGSPPSRRRRTFTKLKGVRLGLADVVHRLEAGAPKDGTVDPKRANALTYTLTALASVLKDEKNLGELAERIAKLEEFAARSGAASERPKLMPLNPR